MSNPLFDVLFGQHIGNSSTFLHVPGGDAWSFNSFLRRSAQFAHALRACDLSAGDRLALQVEKSPECLAIYAACVQSGVILLPLNTAYTVTELSYFIDNSGARLVICDPAKRDAIAPVAEKHGARLETLAGDGSGSLAQIAAQEPTDFETVDRDEDDLAAFLYTSGTTGRSKGAMLTQKNLLSNALVLKEHWRFTAGDRLLHALPIFHTHGLFVGTNVMLAAGGAMIFLPKFDLEQMMRHLPQASAMMGVPTFYTRLLDDARFSRDLTAHMRLFISGSAPLLAETHTAFEKRTGHRILERYGMTETNMNASNPYDGERRAGSVGFPLPGIEIKITDQKGAPLPQGEIGQIEVRGPNVFKGYWQMPEKTAAELRSDGFFITGDLGRFDEDGYLQIIGRDKDLIISGGYNIYPKEIELLLDAQTGIQESAVIGVPHPDFGETVLALIVPQPGAEIDLTRVTDQVTQSLARFKHPRKILQIPELPRNAMGKVQKKVLREAYADSFVT
ncbi:MAG: malonyl-CoA synthase [Pseudomonadota bacterium]